MGDKFRALYGEISRLRSLLPAGTPVIALTATATHHIKKMVTQTLQMNPVKVISRSSNRPNIRYSILKVSSDIHVSISVAGFTTSKAAHISPESDCVLSLHQ